MSRVLFLAIVTLLAVTAVNGQIYAGSVQYFTDSQCTVATTGPTSQVDLIYNYCLPYPVGGGSQKYTCANGIITQSVFSGTSCAGNAVSTATPYTCTAWMGQYRKNSCSASVPTSYSFKATTFANAATCSASTPIWMDSYFGLTSSTCSADPSGGYAQYTCSLTGSGSGVKMNMYSSSDCSGSAVQSQTLFTGPLTACSANGVATISCGVNQVAPVPGGGGSSSSGTGPKALGGFNMMFYNSQQDCTTQNTNAGTSVLFNVGGQQCQQPPFLNYYFKLDAVSGDTGVTVSTWTDSMCASTPVTPFTSPTVLTLDSTCRLVPGTTNKYYNGATVAAFAKAVASIVGLLVGCIVGGVVLLLCILYCCCKACLCGVLRCVCFCCGDKFKSEGTEMGRK